MGHMGRVSLLCGIGCVFGGRWALHKDGRSMCTHIFLAFAVCVLAYLGCLPVLPGWAEIEFEKHYEFEKMVLLGENSCLLKDQEHLKAAKMAHSPVTVAAASAFEAFQSVLAACVDGGHVIHVYFAR